MTGKDKIQGEGNYDAARKFDDVLVGRRVGAVGDPAAPVGGRLDLERERLGEVRHVGECDLERADTRLVGHGVLLQIERVLDQVVVAPGSDDRAERLAAAGRADQPRLLRAGVAGPALDRNRLPLGRVDQRV